ncbi:MAG: hypothetical protein E7503_03315 [Ruminococcus sp.]|nr:hypothetical protein [Ruminococcus sp.]
MKTITKVALSTMTLVAVAAGSVAGTLAYLQSQTPVATNVMASGGVEIQQLELQRAENIPYNHKETKIGDLVPFQQHQVFAPAHPVEGASSPYTAEPTDLFKWGPYVYSGTAANGLWNDDKLEGAIDKFVFVKNTGDSDCYYRTLIAFECPEDTEYSQGSDKEFMMNVNGSDLFDWEETGYITVGGTRYLLMVATYQRALGDGETSQPSLLQVVMTHNATNEDVEKLNGEYEILVMSQACQTENFDSADAALNEIFGAADTTNATKWFSDSLGIVTVKSNEELATAIANGATQITLGEGTYSMPSAAKGKKLTINGTTNSVIEVVPAGQGEANGQLDYSLDGSTVTFNNVTIKTNSQLYAGYARLSATYNDCVIQNTYNLGVGTSEFNNCTFNITNEYLRVGGAYSATFNGCTFNTDGRAILVYQDGTHNDQVVTVKDCTFNATAAASTWNGIHVSAVSIDGSQGGTYVVNLEGTNTVDEDFNGLWQIKKGEENVTVNE